MLTPATAQVVLGAGAAGVSFSCSLHTCTCSTLVPQCDRAVQTVVTSATVYKPREFKSLCARSAGPSCPYCAGGLRWRHNTVYCDTTADTQHRLLPGLHTLEAGGKLGVTTHCSSLGLGLEAGWRLPHCAHYHRVFVVSAVLGSAAVLLDVAPAVARVRLSPAAAARTAARHHASCQLPATAAAASQLGWLQPSSPGLGITHAKYTLHTSSATSHHKEMLHWAEVLHAATSLWGQHNLLATVARLSWSSL